MRQNKRAIRYFVLVLFVVTLTVAFYSTTQAQGVIVEKSLEEATGDLELVHRGETFKGYKLHPILLTPIQVAPDTAALHYYRKCSVEGHGLAIGNNGNYVGPRHYKTFFDRQREWHPFIFLQAFDGLVYKPNQALYYNTQSPYTKLTYHRFGPQEQREEILDMTMAININKQINVGGDFNYFLSRGMYTNNKGREVNYRLFGSLRLPRYELFISGGNNYLKLNENGGLANDNYINRPQDFAGSRQQVSSIEIPVKYTQGVINSLFIGHATLNHRYHFGQTKRFMLGDRLPNGVRTPDDTTLFVAIATVGHKLEYQRGTRIFDGSNSALAQAYGHTYPYYWQKKIIKDEYTGEKHEIGDEVKVAPFDSTRLTIIKNTVSFEIQEGFRPWVKFGMAAYARFENRFYFMRDSIPGNGKLTDFTTYVGGNIHRQTGKGFNFDVNGEVAVVGHDVGNIRINGIASSEFSLWKLPIRINAEGGFYNLKAPILLEHHRGTYLRWDTDFPFSQSLYLGGSLSLPRYGTSLAIKSATLHNYIYFTEDHLPHVYNNALQVMEVRAAHNYNWKKLHWQVEVAYQLSSNRKVLPIPDLATYGALYMQFYIAKRLYTEVGIDAYYHTAYYAPSYDLATQQFNNQNKVLVGNYPLLNTFASFKLRRVRFFLVYNNLADLLLSPSKRWSLAHMPINPAVLRMGISFDFNN